MRALLLAIVLAGCGGAPEIQPPPPSTDSSPQLAHASVSGTVRLNGRWWPDGTSGQLASLDPIEGFDPRRAETLTLGPAGTMADVYITVTSGLDDREFPLPDAPAVVRLDGLVFAPRVIGLLVNQEIEYRNADRVMHGPHSQSRLSPAFGKGSAEAVTREVFVRSESAIPVACDVHPWMRAWIHVSKHPYFSVTKADGRYSLVGLRPGEYGVSAWHERFKDRPLVAKVTVEAGKAATLDFTFEAPKK